jgi:membrane protease YdiL (CAAX protease family)
LIPPNGDDDPGREPTIRPDAPDAPDAPPSRLGTGTFTIEGRTAPALFVVGWLATIAGAAVVFISLQAARGALTTILFVLGLALLSVGLITSAGSQGLERRARGAGAYNGPSPILVFLACIPTAAIGLVLLGIPLELAGVPLDGPGVAVLALVVQGAVYIGLIRLLIVDTGVLTWSQMGVRWPSTSVPRELLAGALWAFPVILLTGPLAYVLATLLQVTPESPLPPTGDPAGIALNLLAGAIVAPVGEELFFRAFATTAWVLSLGATRGIVRAGLVFAFVHVLAIEATTLGEGAGLALIGFASRVPIGLALGWVFVKRGSIWAPLGLHAAFNAILLVVAEMQPDVPT